MSEEAPTFPPIDPSPYEFGIVTASYNQSLCDALLARVTEVLNFSGSPKEVIVERVPGSHEIPSLLKLMLEARPFHCLIGLGVVIKGSVTVTRKKEGDAKVVLKKGTYSDTEVAL